MVTAAASANSTRDNGEFYDGQAARGGSTLKPAFLDEPFLAGAVRRGAPVFRLGLAGA